MTAYDYALPPLAITCYTSTNAGVSVEGGGFRPFSRSGRLLNKFPSDGRF